MKPKKKFTLDEIFDSDEFGLLDAAEKKSNIKSADDRLIDAFEEINTFFDKNGREPGTDSMTEYSLSSKLKNFRENETQKKILKPFDRYNLLGQVDIETPSIDDILSQENDLLDIDSDLSIFKYKHVPQDREEADFVAQRKSMKEKDFLPYESIFQNVHKEIREGKRKVIPFRNIEKNLHVDDFYIIDGVMVYLESADLKREVEQLKSGNRVRIDGRTRTIFENGTYSNMLYRSLGKQIQKSGKMITNPDYKIESDLFVSASGVGEEDFQTGWIYVAKSKSDRPEIASISNLFKIGHSTVPVNERVKNASNEATYLFADVHVLASYAIFNRNVEILENLLHRFFAEVCLDVDIELKGRRITPREWFVAPFEEIEKAIEFIINEQIVNYRYDKELERVVLR